MIYRIEPARRISICQYSQYLIPVCSPGCAAHAISGAVCVSMGAWFHRMSGNKSSIARHWVQASDEVIHVHIDECMHVQIGNSRIELFT